jgi:hypothetical protein
VGKDLLGAGGVARAFAVDAVENVGHEIEGRVYRVARKRRVRARSLPLLEEELWSG